MIVKVKNSLKDPMGKSLDKISYSREINCKSCKRIHNNQKFAKKSMKNQKSKKNQK